jgi:preprotein translocase subunit YajC
LTFAVMTPPPGGSYPAWFMPTQLVLIGVIFWFLLLRPQRKQQKELEALLAGLKKGDEVVTTGGIIGKVVHLTDERVTLQSAEARLIVERSRIVRVIAPKSDEAVAK